MFAKVSSKFVKYEINSQKIAKELFNFAKVVKFQPNLVTLIPVFVFVVVVQNCILFDYTLIDF